MKWFEDGKTNLSKNCLDRHLESKKDKNALVYVKNDPSEEIEFITYEELHTRTCQMANLLKEAGVKGDRVIFYKGMTPELMTGILACTRIGAIPQCRFWWLLGKSAER